MAVAWVREGITHVESGPFSIDDYLLRVQVVRTTMSRWLHGFSFAAVIPIVVAFGSCSLPQPLDLRHPDTAVTVRVGTYNIHSGRSGTQMRLQEVAREIEAAALDIVFLQEVDRGTNRAEGDHQARVLGEALGMHWSFAVADRTMDGGQLGNAVLSRFPIDRDGGARLPGSLFRVRRAATYAIIEGPHNSRILSLSAHFSLDGRDRQRSSSWFVEELADLKGPVIAGVDLNAAPGSAEVEMLESIFALSPAVATYPSPEPRHAIDRIVVAPAGFVSISSSGVSRAGVSDHRLVVAEVLLEPHNPRSKR